MYVWVFICVVHDMCLCGICAYVCIVCGVCVCVCDMCMCVVWYREVWGCV